MLIVFDSIVVSVALMALLSFVEFGLIPMEKVYQCYFFSLIRTSSKFFYSPKGDLCNFEMAFLLSICAIKLLVAQEDKDSLIRTD